MSAGTDTAQAFSHRDAARATKQSFAMGVHALGLTYGTVAHALNVSESIIKAWCDPSRDHCPPAWVVYRLRATHSQLAAYLETALEAYARSGMRPVAHDVDAQANVMLASNARWMAAHADAMAGDGEYDQSELRTTLPLAISVRTNADRFIALAQERLGVTAIRKAGA